MNFFDGRQPIGVEPPREPYQRRPESAMDVGHFTSGEPTHQNVGRFADRA
jgi:hypothetical protein